MGFGDGDGVVISGTDELLTIEEAVRRISMSTRHVRRLVAERQIGHHRLGRSIRLRPADLDAYIAAGRVEPGERGDDG
jgi:excisionase family DNA binding protein